MAAPRFQRRAEPFTCERCGAEAANDGYVNHCPHCLWSKHVDIDPGDRAEECHGPMRPTQVLLEGDRYVLVHACERCGLVRRNRADRRDDPAAIAALFAPAGGTPLPVPPRSRPRRR